jgi:hypothetical protein
MTADGAAEKLRTLPFKAFEDLGFAKIDHHRSLRRGFSEVIFGPGKTPSQIAAIASRLAETGQVVLVTKTTEDAYRAVAAVHPESVWHEEVRVAGDALLAHPGVPAIHRLHCRGRP